VLDAEVKMQNIPSSNIHAMMDNSQAGTSGETDTMQMEDSEEAKTAKTGSRATVPQQLISLQRDTLAAIQQLAQLQTSILQVEMERLQLEKERLDVEKEQGWIRNYWLVTN